MAVSMRYLVACLLPGCLGPRARQQLSHFIMDISHGPIIRRLLTFNLFPALVSSRGANDRCRNTLRIEVGPRVL